MAAIALIVGIAVPPAAPSPAAPAERVASAAVQQPRRSQAPPPRATRLPRDMSVEELYRAKREARERTPAPVAAAVAAAPQEHQEFLGISAEVDPELIAPSDTTGAAGPAHVLTAVNIHYALYPKTATGDDPAPVIPPTPLDTLFPGEAPFIFDPKVVYDPYHERYVLVFLGAGGHIFDDPGPNVSRIFIVAIPAATAEDQGTWCRVAIDGDQVPGFGELWADYPAVGFEANRFYISTNQFTFHSQPNFRYVQILAFEKDHLYGCPPPGAVQATVFARSDTRDPQGFKAFTIQPAVTEGAAAGTPEFLVSFADVQCGGTCGRRVILWRIKEQGGELKLTKRSLKVGVQNLAPFGTQAGGSSNCAGGGADTCWDTGDLRLINAFYDHPRRRLVTAHAIRKNVGGKGYVESSVRWYHLKPAPFNDAAVRRKGLIGAAGRDGGWPVMATDGAGNIFSTYSRAGAPKNEFLSAMAATVPPRTTTAQVRKLRAGEAQYDRLPGPERWGDYNGINRDPNDPAMVWTVNQYAKDVGPTVTQVWQQVVNRVSFG